MWLICTLSGLQSLIVCLFNINCKSLTTEMTAGTGVLAVLCTMDRASGRCDSRAAAKFVLWRGGLNEIHEIRNQSTRNVPRRGKDAAVGSADGGKHDEKCHRDRYHALPHHLDHVVPVSNDVRVALLLKYRGAYLSSTVMKRNLVAHSLATASELMTSMGARMVR